MIHAAQSRPIPAISSLGEQEAGPGTLRVNDESRLRPK